MSSSLLISPKKKYPSPNTTSTTTLRKKKYTKKKYPRITQRYIHLTLSVLSFLSLSSTFPPPPLCMHVEETPIWETHRDAMTSSPSLHPLFVELIAVVGGAGGGGKSWKIHRDDCCRARSLDLEKATAATLETIRFEPHVEQVWPDMKRCCKKRRKSGEKGCQLEYLSLPSGVRVKEVVEDHKKKWDPVSQDVSLFSYMITTRVGTRFYGTSLQYWDDMGAEEEETFWSEAFPATTHPLTKLERSAAKLATLRSITLLSQFSLTEVAKEILLYIFRSLGTSPCIENVISWAANNIYLPKSESRVDVQLFLGSRLINIKHSANAKAVNAEHYGLEHVIESVPLPALVLLLECVLLEKRVVLQSRCKTLLTAVFVMIFNVIAPLQYPHVAIPLLPLFSRMQEALCSPVPFFIGVVRPTEEEIQRGVQPCKIPSDVVVFDLDEEGIAVIAPQDEVLPEIPREVLQPAERRYKSLLKGFTLSTHCEKDYDTLSLQAVERRAGNTSPSRKLPCTHPSFPREELCQVFANLVRSMLEDSHSPFGVMLHATQIYHMHHTTTSPALTHSAVPNSKTVVITSDRDLRQGGGDAALYKRFPVLDKALLGEAMYLEEREIMLAGGDDDAPSVGESWTRLMSVIREVERKRDLLCSSPTEERSKARRLLRTTAASLMSKGESGGGSGSGRRSSLSSGKKWLSSKFRRNSTDSTPTPEKRPDQSLATMSTSCSQRTPDKLGASGGDLASSSSCGMTSTPRELTELEEGTQKVTMADDGSVVIKLTDGPGFAGAESVKLQFDCSSQEGVTCPECSRRVDPKCVSGMNFLCSCGHQFVPLFSVIAKHVSSAGTAGDDVVLSSSLLQYHWITNRQILREAVALHANGTPADATLIEKHPTTFWNVVRVFREIAVPIEIALPSV